MGTNRAEDDGLAAVLEEELMGARDVLALHPPVDAPGLVDDSVAEEAVRDSAADGVVHRIAHHGRHHQDGDHHLDPQGRGRGQRAGREQQRVAREKRRHDEAGLREDDGEQDAVHDGPVL